MKIGVFCPIGNNGWLLSENAPQYKPSFEMNKQIVQRAEHYGFDFALSMESFNFCADFSPIPSNVDMAL